MHELGSICSFTLAQKSVSWLTCLTVVQAIWLQSPGQVCQFLMILFYRIHLIRRDLWKNSNETFNMEFIVTLFCFYILLIQKGYQDNLCETLCSEHDLYQLCTKCGIVIVFTFYNVLHLATSNRQKIMGRTCGPQLQNKWQIAPPEALMYNDIPCNTSSLKPTQFPKLHLWCYYYIWELGNYKVIVS